MRGVSKQKDLTRRLCLIAIVDNETARKNVASRTGLLMRVRRLLLFNDSIVSSRKAISMSGSNDRRCENHSTMYAIRLIEGKDDLLFDSRNVPMVHLNVLNELILIVWNVIVSKNRIHHSNRIRSVRSYLNMPIHSIIKPIINTVRVRLVRFPRDVLNGRKERPSLE